MANFPAVKGKDCTIKVYSNGKPVYVAAKNWTVEQNATEVQDAVCGEDRDRLSLVTNYFSASVDIFHTDEALMQALIDQQTNDDATAPQLVQSLSIRIKHYDGTKSAYRLDGVVLGPWSMNFAGRAESNMTSLKLRFTKWAPVKAI